MMMMMMKLNVSLQDKRAYLRNFSLVAVGVDCGTGVVLPVTALVTVCLVYSHTS
jgi:predicted Na+-dependent transporter